MSFIHVQPVLKKAKKVVLYWDSRERQWVGDSSSAYRLYDIPAVVGHDNIFDMMGLDDKKRSKYLTFDKKLPQVFLGDYGEAVDWMVPFMLYGDLYQVIRSGEQTICVLEHYLKPLKCFDQKEYRIEEVGGLKYLVVNVGTMPVAVILGEPVGKEMVNRLQYTVDCLETIAVPPEKKLFDPDTLEVDDEE